MRLPRFLAAIAVVGSFFLTTAGAFAAAPDGIGPWADSVVTAAQGMQKSGSAVVPDRSDTTSALGVAESSGAAVDPSSTPGTYFSLGFGGSITLGFANSIRNGPGNDLRVYEVTVGTYPDEQVKVEVSPNGATWTTVANSLARDGEVDLGQYGVSCAQYVRLTDVSNVALFDPAADGYDVDAVQALNSSTDSCQPHQWTGGVKSHGYWKNHPRTVDTWNGLADGPVKGNACQNLANQAIGFLNNWNANPVYNGVAFQNAYFNSNGLSSVYDGKTIQQIYTQLNSTSCAAPASDLLALKDVLDWINNGQYLWY